VTAGTMAAINAVWLAAGFALVLWGLRIFKLWVAGTGLVAGAFLGAAFASVVFGTRDATLAGSLAGAFLGALAAWPLQKIVVFIAAGTTAALVVAAGAVAIAGADNVAIVSIIGFVGGGLLAMWAYDVVVIAAMAFTGAQAVFHAAYVPFDVYNNAPSAIASRLLGIYALRFPVFVATTVLFIGFSLWYQRGPGRKRERSPAGNARAIAARRISIRFAVLIVLAWLFAAALVAAGIFSASTFELVGMHPISWPVVALAALPFIRPRPAVIQMADGDVTRPRSRTRRRLLGMAAFGAIVPPVLTAGLFVAYGETWVSLSDFYRSFFSGPGTVIAAKWAYSLCLLPLVLVRAHPVTIVSPPVEPEPTGEETAESEDAGGTGAEEPSDDDVLETEVLA